MERPKVRIVVILLIIIMIVGRVGLSIPQFQDFFASLTPITLLICFLLVIIYQEQKTYKFWIGALAVWLIGMSSEWIGVHTGFLFGDYKYSSRLGISIYDVPLLIGCNWVLLCLSSIYILKPFAKNRVVTAFLGAILLVGFDIFLEHFAIKFNLWNWNNEQIPIKNYRDWLLVAFLGNLILYSSSNNRIIFQVFIILFLFIFSFCLW